MKEEIFAELVKIVSRETEITREMIVSKCSKAEVVDARYILARLLHDAGFINHKSPKGFVCPGDPYSSYWEISMIG